MASMALEDWPNLEMPCRAEVYGMRIDLSTGDVVMYVRIRVPWHDVPWAVRPDITHPPTVLLFCRVEWAGWREGRPR